MCGIIGYTGPRKAAPILIEGLKRLEYRGYDSAGIGVGCDGALTICKKVGKIKDLREAVPDDLDGCYGIGHTRWATHGGVTDVNAHPHTDTTGNLAIAHNGIIENYLILKARLEAEGITFRTETDSEVIAHLIAQHYEGDLEAAVRKALPLLKGTYGIVCLHKGNPQLIIGARSGSPLVVGVGEDEMFLASDVTAVLAHTKQVVYLEDGEVVVLTEKDFHITDLNERKISKTIDEISWELEEIEKGDFKHYMVKEIYEQPEAIERACRGRLDPTQATARLGGLNLSPAQLLDVERIRIIAAGTSYYAGLVGSYLIEQLARIPCQAELASEVRYRNPIVERNTLHFAVSQSGETADTLYAMRELQRKGSCVLGICNVVGSTIARESNGGVYIHSGPEIAVASTKAFSSQVTAFYLFCLLMARKRHMSYETGEWFLQELTVIPEAVKAVLKTEPVIKKLAKKYAGYKDFLFLGRGINYPVALEGALKLKEIAYIHAEGYSAAEIKHGPIALINEETPSMFLVPDDRLREKVISNMKEVKARRGKLIAVVGEGDDEIREIADDVIEVPRVHTLFSPFVMVVPLQLFAYHCAVLLGRDVDQPRNLAKSVTVE
ncbi:MAG: glutamine--fructose-6-phosphate transaminase (isomerizing) [Spirochaetales bacterium]|nr:glutamine--fructose-6-phosphate transaminase (isomerizing) [Spirochaetales bacterium]